MNLALRLVQVDPTLTSTPTARTKFIHVATIGRKRGAGRAARAQDELSEVEVAEDGQCERGSTSTRCDLPENL